MKYSFAPSIVNITHHNIGGGIMCGEKITCEARKGAELNAGGYAG